MKSEQQILDHYQLMKAHAQDIHELVANPPDGSTQEQIDKFIIDENHQEAMNALMRWVLDINQHKIELTYKERVTWFIQRYYKRGCQLLKLNLGKSK